MQVEVENLSDWDRQLKVQVPVTQVKKAFAKTFEEVKQKVTVKGFRKGRAPLAIIRNLYGSDVRGDVAQNLVQNSYIKALHEHNLMPLSRPEIDFTPPEENQDFSFTAKFQVQPEVQLTQIENLEVKKEAVSITQEMVEEKLEQVLKPHIKVKDVLLVRELKQGDLANIDFKGFIHGEPLENAADQDHRLEIGSKSFIPGFEDALLGMKPQETRTLHLQFPEDYGIEDLNGQPVQFEVTLNKIQEKEEPILDDDFVKELSAGKQKTVEEFKAQLKKEMTEAEEKKAQEKLKDQVFEALVAANPFEVHETLIKDQEDELRRDFEKKLEEKDPQRADELMEKKGPEFSKKADFMVRVSLLIFKVARENNLTVSESEYEAEVQEIADLWRWDFSEMKEICNTKSRRRDIELHILEDKVFEFLLEKVKYQD